MEFSTLEITMLSLVLTALGGIIVGIVVRYLGANRFVHRRECEEKHSNDCRFNQDMYRKIEEIKQQQAQCQDKTLERNRVLFRMLRGLVIYSEMSDENKEKILNERAGAE